MSAPTLEQVVAIVMRIAGPSRSPADAARDTLLAEGGFWLDSVHLLEAVLACEEAFGVTFDPGSDFTDDTLRTVGTLLDLIRAKRSG